MYRWLHVCIPINVNITLPVGLIIKTITITVKTQSLCTVIMVVNLSFLDVWYAFALFWAADLLTSVADIWIFVRRWLFSINESDQQRSSPSRWSGDQRWEKKPRNCMNFRDVYSPSLFSCLVVFRFAWKFNTFRHSYMRYYDIADLAIRTCTTNTVSEHLTVRSTLLTSAVCIYANRLHRRSLYSDTV